MSASEFIENALRTEIRRILEKLPVTQQQLFTRCLPPGKILDTTEEDKLRGLYELCERSLAKLEKS
jgi:hypothetical protein